MFTKRDKNIDRVKRHKRVRKKVSGTAECPRLSVYRSLNHIYAQIIDDNTHSTLVSATTLSKEFEGKFETSAKSIEAAKALGAAIAKKAIEKGIKEVMFDRGGRVYHGRIKALADAAREAGLKF